MSFPTQEPDVSLVIAATRVRSVRTEASKSRKKTLRYGVEQGAHDVTSRIECTEKNAAKSIT